jgi:hypothetical protein
MGWKPKSYDTEKDSRMEDAITQRGAETLESDGWSVAGVLTDLSGALLTTLPGEAGLAGTVELAEDLRRAANDEHYEGDMKP